MAKVPTIGIGSTQLANPNLTTQAPQAEQTQTLGVGKGVTAFGGSLETTGDAMYKKLDDARNYANGGEAEIFLAEGINKIQLREMNATEIGPDGKTLRRKTNTPENIAKIDQEMNGLLETAKNFHTSKEYLARSLPSYSKALLTGKHDVQKIYMKNSIEEGQMVLEKKVDAAKRDIINGVPDAEDNLKALYEEANLLGFLDADVAYNKTQAALEEADFSTYLKDRSINSEQADKDLQSGSKYKNMKEDARSRAIANIGNLKAQDRYQQELNVYNLSDLIDEGDRSITPEFIDGLVNKSKDGIPPGAATRLKKSVYTKQQALVKDLDKDPNISKGDAKRSYDYYDTIITLANEKDQYTQFGMVLDAFNDKKLSDNERKNLNKVILGRNSFGLEFQTTMKNMATAFANIGASTQTIALGTADLVRKIASGESQKKAQNDVIKDVVDKTLPGAALAKDSPNAVATYNGVTRAFNGDTTLQADIKGNTPSYPIKIGDVKTLKNGKVVKVTKVNPNGTYSGEEVK